MADFQAGEAPSARLRGRFVASHRADKRIDDLAAGMPEGRRRPKFLALVTVDMDAGRRQPDVALLAQHDDRPEVLVLDCRLQFRAAAIGARRLEPDLFFGAGDRAKRAPRLAIGRHVLASAEFADPVHPDVAVEMRVAGIGEGSEAAALERDQC